MVLGFFFTLNGCGESRDGPSGGPTVPPTNSGNGTSTGTNTGTSQGGGGTGGSTSCTPPSSQYLPTSSGSCPTLSQGKLTFNFGSSSRDVEIRISSAADTKDGPFVIVWHAMNETPLDALAALGTSTIDAITAAGGVVAAPYADPVAGFYPWFYCLGNYSNDADLQLMEQVLSCAIESVGVDLCRIHTVGYAEGAMNAAPIAVMRSGYIASLVVHSVSLAGSPVEQDGSNVYPAMILHAGTGDQSGIDFGKGSEDYYELLTVDGEGIFANKHFAIICDHGGGHTIATDALDSAWQFLQDHPFGTDPSPYAGGLPASFPAYCSL